MCQTQTKSKRSRKKSGSLWNLMYRTNVKNFFLKVSFRAYSLTQDSITRNLYIVAILTKNKDEKQFFVNKTTYSA